MSITVLRRRHAFRVLLLDFELKLNAVKKAAAINAKTRQDIASKASRCKQGKKVANIPRKI
jgi:hypothetical protein